MTTSDNIAAIEKALEGVTSGPWFVSGVRFRMNGSEWHSVNRYDDAKKRDEGIACVSFDPRTGEGLADARFIAACNPVAISALLAEARKAEAMEREIAEKDARIAALEAGLHAFAECAGEWDGEPESLHVFFEWNDENTPVPSLPVANFRRARTLLNGGSDAQG